MNSKGNAKNGNGLPSWVYIGIRPTDRWWICLHEAGHVAAMWFLKKERLVGAYVSGDIACSLDNGHADTWNDAIMVAAGRAAEELAGRAKPPPLPGGRPQLDPILSTPSFHAKERREYPQVPDHVWLARWTITGLENWPERWAPRIRQVQREAERFVAHRAHFIVRLAEQLYLHGLILPEDVEELLHAARQGTTECPTEGATHVQG